MQAILKISLISLFIFISQLTFAGSFVDSATVTSVEKVYKNYRVDEPYQDCYIQETVQSGDGSATNELMGAVIGGAIGNKLGKGDGNDAMTLFGALMGASIANDAEKLANTSGKKVIRQEVCETKTRQVIEKRLSHYLVTVDYAGRDVSFKSNRRPSSDVIKIEVTVDGLGN
ncbi:glycine zipper 2TM domain-containing protein [Candidatus Thioglobus sp.]|nr:glycine zipper 2TM domain-containing protein [Candidatus Thioglobus sp.]